MKYNQSAFHNESSTNLLKKIEFFKRECIFYVNNERTNLCEGCKRSKSEHFESTNESIQKWDYKICTILSTTDAFGVLTFPGSHSKRADYIRIENETKPSNMLKFMLSPKGWSLSKPELIISITGGAKNFKIPLQMKKAFKRGLIKAASSTGAWIITGGTNTGVMRLVGEAVAEEFDRHIRSKITVLGIATWGKVAMRNRMIFQDQNSNNKSKLNYAEKNQSEEVDFFYSKKENSDSNLSTLANDDVCLDPNHTHFILVDDGSVGYFGKEIEFRSSFEEELRKNNGLTTESENLSFEENERSNIPMILIVVQGGKHSLQLVKETIEKNIPILILSDSKGCPDLIINACKYSEQQCDDEYLRKLMEQAEMFEKYKNTPDYNNIIVKYLGYLKKIIEKKHLINVFSLENEEDIEMSILRALLNLNKNQCFENLKLALKWNRDDIAKQDIFNGEEEFTPNELNQLMQLALLDNRPDFVELLLDNGLDLKSFLTVERLQFLYNYHRDHHYAIKSPFFRLFKTNEIDGMIKIDKIEKFLENYMFEDFRSNFLNNLDINKPNAEVEYPEKNLFLWAILMNRFEISKIFWKIGHFQIATALFASSLCKSMSVYIEELEQDLKIQAEKFEEMACGILDVFDNLSENIIIRIVLLQKIPFYDLNCLKLAEEASCLNFISHPIVQNLLTDLWFGKIKSNSIFKFGLSFISFGLLAPFLMFNNDSQKLKLNNHFYTFQNLKISNLQREKAVNLLKKFFINDEIYKEEVETDFFPKKKKENYSDTEHNVNDTLFVNVKIDENTELNANKPKVSRFKFYWKQFRYFFCAPVVHFFYENILYTIFICLFSYMMLCDFNYNSNQIINSNKSDLNFTNFTDQYESNESESKFFFKNIQFTEIIITFWIFNISIEELRQFIFSETEKKLSKKISKYFSDSWNYIDFCGCLIYFIGFILRLISLFTNENIFIAARLIYAFDLTIWYLRILHIAMVFKSLGPKLVMIRKMVYDLLFFIVIILIFVLSFGITTQATMYPGSKLDYELFLNIINNAYWPIYGDTNILEKINDNNENCTDQKCPIQSGKYYSLAALIVYMIIANVLLLNLLIAMFSSTFEMVHEKTDIIWKYQRFNLIFENFYSSVFVPPFSAFAYLTSMINKIRREKIDSNDIVTIERGEISLEKKFAEEYLRNQNFK